MSPYSFVKKEGLIHWQESLFNQWRNARYSALFVSSSLWPCWVFTWRKNNQVRACVSMLGATTPPSFVFFLLLQKIPHVLQMWSAIPQLLQLVVRFSFSVCIASTTCLSLAVGVDVRVRPLHWAHFTITLCILNDCCVAEVVLVPSLNAESPLCTHPPHCLFDVHRTNVLQPGQADVQCTEGSLLIGEKKQQSWEKNCRTLDLKIMSLNKST